ncbi:MULTISPECIES: hypothetical protein [unclassified Rickettsia]
MPRRLQLRRCPRGSNFRCHSRARLGVVVWLPESSWRGASWRRGQ